MGLRNFLFGDHTSNKLPAPKVTSKKVALPAGGRVSTPNHPSDLGLGLFNKHPRYKIVKKQFLTELIPVIRGLSMMNEDVSQAMWNIVNLGNTGHKIFFDRHVDNNQVEAMRNHLTNKKLEWVPGGAGRDALVNKMFYQILIGGALATEWVPNSDLTGLATTIFVKPEDIEFVLDEANTRYMPYQRVHFTSPENLGKKDLIKLNPATFKYFALNGDTEIPYGIPPYLPVLPGIEMQTKMKDNISFVVDQLGLLGFLTALLGKPEMNDHESDQQYEARLNTMLAQAKDRIKGGFRDGVTVGYKDDLEFEFSSLAKDYTSALALFKNNESLVASGMKQDPTLWGRDYNTSETQITVVFMKMISELRNIQNIIKTNLEFGYALELRLAGFKFDYITVQFNPSTLNDDMKYQQAQEIKIRNVKDKMMLGIIDQQQAADELGYEAPAFDEPVVPWEVIAGGKDPAEIEQQAKAKDANDKKNRAKKKAVPKDK